MEALERITLSKLLKRKRGFRDRERERERERGFYNGVLFQGQT